MTMVTALLPVLAMLLCCICCTAYPVRFARPRHRQLSMSTPSTLPVATLDGNTLWRLAIRLEKPGSKSIEAVVRLRFVEDRGYEPPQGRIFVEDDFYGMIKVDDKGYASRWMLSEDKNDRKDGLWIWGLFEEPKYPYLYFSLFVFKSIILASGLEEPIFGGDGVPGDRLNFRFSHFRNDPAKGAELTAGEMTYDIAETVQADPFGLGGTVNVGEPVPAGQVLGMRPVFKDDREDEPLFQSIAEAQAAAAASAVKNGGAAAA